MKRVFAFGSLILLLAACAGRVDAPRNTENACLLLAERPDFARALIASERKWGVPVHVQLSTIYQESSFRGDARPPRGTLLGIIPWKRASSAYGYAQAVDGTWEEYQEKEGGRWSRRDRIDDAADFMGWYMHNTAQSMGISKQDAASQYLAFHEGRTGYRRGSYKAKPWLIDVSRRVATRSDRFAGQLATCQMQMR